MSNPFKSSSKSSPSDSSKGKKDKNNVDFGSPFPEAILNTPYQYFLNFPSKYDIYLDSSGYHWYIIVQCNMDGVNLPKISFEITCDKLFKGVLIPTMRVIENNSDTLIVAYGRAAKVAGGTAGVHVVDDAKAGDAAGPVGSVLGTIASVAVTFGVTAVGAVGAITGVGGVQGAMLLMSGIKLRKVSPMTTTIMKLCETAEAVRVGMGNYNLITNNCQHFCNNVLKKLGLPTTPTTVGVVGTTTDVKGNFDDIDQIFAIAAQKM